MTISYDGTSYGGWQIQPNTNSIQHLIQEALSTFFREKTDLTGSGRTDAGVHAHAQIAHFYTEKTFLIRKLQHSLNCMLPHDIRIIQIEEISPLFHARYSATGKIYHYHLHLDPLLNPFTRLYSFQPRHRVDISLLAKACSFFVGTKDFSAFANESHKGAASKNAVRTMKRLDVVQEPGGVRLEFEADGFLYKMVRNITGTLLDICAGHIDLLEIDSIFQSKDRSKAGKTAPPHGLFLMQVHYKKEREKSSSNE